VALDDAGCGFELEQGWFFSKPQPARDVLADL
jgi:sensor c-di-GMP phosphodiesterase-like protein